MSYSLLEPLKWEKTSKAETCSQDGWGIVLDTKTHFTVRGLWFSLCNSSLENLEIWKQCWVRSCCSLIRQMLLPEGMMVSGVNSPSWIPFHRNSCQVELQLLIISPEVFLSFLQRICFCQLFPDINAVRITRMRGRTMCHNNSGILD